MYTQSQLNSSLGFEPGFHCWWADVSQQCQMIDLDDIFMWFG